jgi:hypothetical protein
MVTATPTEQNLRSCGIHLPLQVNRFYSVETQIYQVPSFSGSWLTEYFKICLSAINSFPKSAKFLIFIPDIKMGQDFLAKLPFQSSLLSSKTSYDENSKIILSTSVSDSGLTIPSVDVVISPDFDRFVDKDEDVADFTLLSDEIIEQRKGRTGRTNNGTFLLVCFKLHSIKHKKNGAFEKLKFLLSLFQEVDRIENLKLNIFEQVIEENLENESLDVSLLAADFKTHLSSFLKNFGPGFDFRKKQIDLEDRDFIPLDMSARGRTNISRVKDLSSLNSNLIQGVL